MKQLRASSVLPLLAATVLLLGAGRLSAASIHVDSGFDDAIDLDGDDVIVSAEDDSEARITPTGDLRIEGQRVAVNSQQRRALTEYNETVHSIVDRAAEIGIQGAGIAFSALGAAVEAIASGDTEKVEKRVEAKAERLKHNARLLCIDVRHLQRIQDAIADDLETFRPFAVIEERDADGCRVED